MGRGTVIASLVASVVEGAASAGIDRAALLAAVGLRDARLDPDADRVPYPAYVALWEEIGRRTGDPCFGLHLAERVVDADTFSVVGFAARSSATYGDAVRRVMRYSHVLNDTTHTDLAIDGDVAVITDGPRDPAQPWPRHKAECIVASYVVLGRRWTKTAWSPRAIELAHARPDDCGEHARLLGCTPSFGRLRNRIVIDASILELPIVHAEPRLLRFLDRRAESMAPPPESTLADEVRRAIGDSLGGGQPALADVARRLGTTPRTLQRRLGEEGLGFADLVDDVRRSLALRLLDERSVAIDEISWMLGFSEPKAFRRAFRRWTGATPRAFRERAR